MNKYIAGFIAGFIASVVLSVLMVIKSQLGLMPQFNVVHDMTHFFGAESLILGWVLHFILGTVIWGALFAVINPSLAGPYWLKGIFFAIIAWLLMMVGYMPVMDHGLFASTLGLQVLVATLVLHVIYGFVLGLVYGLLPKA